MDGTLPALSQAELQARACDFLQRALTQDWPASLSSPSQSLQELVLAGGYPEMRERATLARRQSWARSYMTNMMERDVQDIANIDQLAQIPRLLSLLATQCAQLLNYAQLGGHLGLNAKTPKLHFLDAGLQATLTRLTPELLFIQRERWVRPLPPYKHRTSRAYENSKRKPAQISSPVSCSMTAPVRCHSAMVCGPSPLLHCENL
jgi:hypothetical protein